MYPSLVGVEKIGLHPQGKFGPTPDAPLPFRLYIKSMAPLEIQE